MQGEEEPQNPETQEPDNEREKSKEHSVEGSGDQKPKMKRLKKKADGEGVKDEVMKSQVSDAGVSSSEEGIKRPEFDSPSDGKEVAMESLLMEAIRNRVPFFKSEAE